MSTIASDVPFAAACSKTSRFIIFYAARRQAQKVTSELRTPLSTAAACCLLVARMLRIGLGGGQQPAFRSLSYPLHFNCHQRLCTKSTITLPV
jgi:hypothetical protein